MFCFFSPDCAFEWCCQGEKYLVLKKKYRQLLQEKEAKHPRMDGEEQSHPSPTKTAAAAAAAAQWDARDSPTCCLQQDEPMSCAAEVKLAISYYYKKKTTNKQSVRGAAGATRRRRTTIALCVT